MQHLDLEIIAQAKAAKLATLEKEFAKNFIGVSKGELVECPSCHYISKNKRFTCKVFDDAVKCFACGLWRRI